MDSTISYMAMSKLRGTHTDDITLSWAELWTSEGTRQTSKIFTRFLYNCEEKRKSVCRRQDHVKKDAHAKELPQLVFQQPV